MCSLVGFLMGWLCKDGENSWTEEQWDDWYECWTEEEWADWRADWDEWDVWHNYGEGLSSELVECSTLG